jgi:protein TonB
LFQSRSVSAAHFVERVRNLDGRRALGFGVACLIEVLILLLLLTLGREQLPGVKEDRPTEVTFIAPEISEDAPKARRPEPERRAEARPVAQQPQPEEPRPPQPAQPAPAPPAPPVPILPMRFQLAPSAPAPQPAQPARPVYGPVDRGRPSAFRDTERVGTAPNGEPLYAAEWYREPEEHMMHTYLSTANGPGWGLIACRTAPDYRVEDCVPLAEYPEGSQINRSVLAAAWEFRVRPPRRGGQPLVGSWVRIRIDYDLARR